jgi:hypothetical protein
VVDFRDTAVVVYKKIKPITIKRRPWSSQGIII